MVKTHHLRNWVIAGLTGMLLTLVVLGLGVWFRDTECAIIGTTFVDGANLNAIAWLPVACEEWFTGFLGEAFTGMFMEGMFSASAWQDYHFVVDNLVWLFVVILSLVLFIAILVKAIKRHKGKYVAFALFFLVFAGIAVCCTSAYYFARHCDWTFEAGKLVYDGMLPSVVHGSGSTVFWSMVKALSFDYTNELGYVVSILAYVLCLAALLYIVSYIGMAATALYRLKAVEEEVAVEETVAPVVETPQEEVKPEPVPEKKRGILVVSRYDKYGNFGPLVLGEAGNYPKESTKAKGLTVEEVKRIIKEETEKAEARRIIEEYRNEKHAEAIANAVIKATATQTVSVPTPTTSKTLNEGSKEEKVYPSPIIFAMPTAAKEEGVVKEAVKKEEAPKVEKKGLTEDEVKEIIASEIKAALKDLVIKHEKIVEKQVIVPVHKEEKVEEPVKEEPKVEEEKVTEAPVVEETPVVEEPKVEETTVVEETKVSEAPVAQEEVKEEEKAEETTAEEAPVVEEPVEEVTSTSEVVTTEEAKAEEPAAETPVSDVPLTSTGKPKIIRIPFTTRMLGADETMQNAYNHVKSVLMSYGTKSRVSNSGDTFRKNKITLCKIVVAGKSLKLYIALDPQDYVDSTYPIKDASSKNIYKETPLVFKVRSGLSLRRVDELIRDCMDKHGFDPIDQVQEHDWVKELQNAEVEDDGIVEDEEE